MASDDQQEVCWHMAQIAWTFIMDIPETWIFIRTHVFLMLYLVLS